MSGFDLRGGVLGNLICVSIIFGGKGGRKVTLNLWHIGQDNI